MARACHNNSLLKKYVENYCSKNEEKTISENEFFKLKEQNAILEEQLKKMIIRDVNLELKQQEIDNLLREINNLKIYSNNLKGQLLEARQNHTGKSDPNKVVSINQKRP